MEKWKDVKDTNYQVSNLGKVRNKSNGYVIKQQLSHRGYWLVRIKDKNGKKRSFSVHRLVAIAFVSNPKAYSEINHIDGDKSNNNRSNLQWCTRGQNIQHAWDNGLRRFTEKTREAVLENIKKAQTPDVLARKRYPRSKKTLCVETGQVFKSMKEAADFVGAHEQNIQECCASNGRRTAKGFHWEYM